MPTIIAECCQNHKGDRATLEKMIWSAADAGADYAKIQSIRADDLTRRARFEEGVVEDGVTKAIRRPHAAEYARLKPMDLSLEDHAWFVDRCKAAGIKPLTTIFSRSLLPELAGLGWDAVKVASYDCASPPLLRDLARHFRHLFVSTGATLDGEIDAAAKALGDHSFSLLHCVTIYPTPLDQMHLARMEWLRRFTQSVGFSDHSLVARDGLQASIFALALGADVVERHFTVLAPSETKDGPVSINPAQLADLVAYARMPRDELRALVERTVPEWRTMLGDARRPLSHEELLNRDYYRGRFATHVGDRVWYNWQEEPGTGEE